MSTLLPTAIRGTLIYEAKIASRQRILWISVVPLLALGVLIGFTSPTLTQADSVPGRIAGWVLALAVFSTFGFGVALADRFSNHRRRSQSELLDATPASLTMRMAASLIAAMSVALVPALVVTLVVGGAYTAEYAMALPVALAAFALILVPGALLLATLAVALGTILPAPLARAGAVIVWGWATLLNTALLPIPTITGSVLSPLGDYASLAWFNGPTLWAGRLRGEAIYPAVTTGSALFNVAFALLASVVLFALAQSVVRMRR
jgi:ABC-2 type transport system permease protein